MLLRWRGHCSSWADDEFESVPESAPGFSLPWETFGRTSIRGGSFIPHSEEGKMLVVRIPTKLFG